MLTEVNFGLQEYNQFQVKQLTKLIEVTRTDLKKEDRQKVMNMITIDAHSRDMVESIAESGIDRCLQIDFAFCWMLHAELELYGVTSAIYNHYSRVSWGIKLQKQVCCVKLHLSSVLTSMLLAEQARTVPAAFCLMLCTPSTDYCWCLCRADCFQWMCQLRSYWDSTVNDCRIRICDATFPYGCVDALILTHAMLSACTGLLGVLVY